MSKDKETDGILGTSHLPTEVVIQPATIIVWMTTDNDNPRRGGHTIGITLGGKVNPVLTADESTYVAAILQAAVDKIKDGWAEVDGKGRRKTTEFEWPPRGGSIAETPPWEGDR